MRHILLVGAFALTAQAQSPEAVQRRAVEERLSSFSPADRAWGAYLAGNYKLPEFVPRIQQLLLEDDSLLQRAALDALIRLEASEVPQDLLTKLLPKHFDPVAILLLRNPAQAQPVFLRLMNDTLTDHQWFVVHSGLIASRAPRQAAALVLDWTLGFRIRVVDAATPDRQSAGGIGACWDGPPQLRSNYPPVVNFEIGQHRSIPLLGGPPALTYDKDSCVFNEGIDRRTFTLDYLRYLAAYEAPLPNRRVLFTGDTDFTRSMAALKAELGNYLLGLRDALVKAGSIDAQEWRQPKIEIEAEDARSGPHTPLPSVDWLI